jgi:predicted phage terminase large subunit-like protein
MTDEYKEPPKPFANEDKMAQLAISAKREIASRELARRDLLQFVKRMMPTYQAGWVHKEIADALMQFYDDVLAGKSPRLAIFMPPRHGKSQLASIMFPAWALGRTPTLEIVMASYAANLSVEMSKKARELLRDPDYANVFPDTKLHKDMASVDAWKTTRLGGYTAVGTDGGLTGKGANILIIDDPISNRQEAESEAARRNNWDWYTSTAYTRLAPQSGILLIQTRWHEDDLGGRIEENTADPFKIIRYPAIAEVDEPNRRAGEALHPARYDETALLRIKNTVGTRDWNALYQQNPVPTEGDLFKAANFKYYDEAPDALDMTTFVAWDLSTGVGTDYTVGVVAGVDRLQNLYILDVVRKRSTSLDTAQTILDTAKQWKTQQNGMEVGQLKATIEPILEKLMYEQKHYITISKLSPGRSNKAARAMNIIARMEQGKVLFPKQAGWLSDFEAELLKFPNGRNDDQVDALAYIGWMINDVSPPQETKEKPKPSWKDRLKKLGVRGGTTHMSA